MYFNCKLDLHLRFIAKMLRAFGKSVGKELVNKIELYLFLNYQSPTFCADILFFHSSNFVKNA